MHSNFTKLTALDPKDCTPTLKLNYLNVQGSPSSFNCSCSSHQFHNDLFFFSRSIASENIVTKEEWFTNDKRFQCVGGGGGNSVGQNRQCPVEGQEPGFSGCIENFVIPSIIIIRSPSRAPVGARYQGRGSRDSSQNYRSIIAPPGRNL